ncbi:DNA N-glycosylase and apurinic/apyrimidinic (AP) lyase [Phlyctochytrium planicorne]|nr:DNA N-glycosylase and apurinic/apyrimidinic (AP) lyase [Phlyctochytrium planicorne]
MELRSKGRAAVSVAAETTSKYFQKRALATSPSEQKGRKRIKQEPVKPIQAFTKATKPSTSRSRCRAEKSQENSDFVKNELISDIEDVPADLKVEEEEVQVKSEKAGKGKGKIPKQKAVRSEPQDWRKIYDLIKDHRKENAAPVDTMGCGGLASKNESPETYRFQTLVALMLSSQTKDPVTAAAVERLQTQLPGGLTIDSVSSAKESEIMNIIYGVGFHQKKSVFLKKAANICKEQYDGDIPPTVDELVKLPGVGPKMAYLAMQCAWNVNSGIGVDTHVHRISNRLGWVKSKDAEETREQLELWLPKELWTEINPLLVGFGQTMCGGVSPKCGSCPVAHLCSKIGVKRSRATIKKEIKAEDVKMEDVKDEMDIVKEEIEVENVKTEE